MEDAAVKQDNDMELTAERVKMIQDALLRQYCDQYGLEIVGVRREGEGEA